MHKIERRKILLDFLKGKTFYNMNELTEYIESMGIAYVTLRRDLKELENEGIISLLYGGIKVNEKNNKDEVKRLNKINHNVEAKQAIAKIAQNLVEKGDVIFVGAGTTCEEFVKKINVEIKLITNSWFIYEIAANNPYIINPILLGGKYRNSSGAFVGSFTEKALKIVNYNKAFIGATNIDVQGNLYNNNENESYLETLILNKVKNRYVLADSSKFNSIGYDNFYFIDDLTYIVTDQISESNLELKSKLYTV